MWVLATAACRDATNGRRLHRARPSSICRQPRSSSSVRQARGQAVRARRRLRHSTSRTASSATSAAARSNWSTCMAHKLGRGVTLPLGGLRAAGHLRRARSRRPRRSSRRRWTSCRSSERRRAAPSTPSAAPGARWRGCTCGRRGYPLHVMHNYVIPARDALEFAALVQRVEAETLSTDRVGLAARRPLLAYGALVLERSSSCAKPPKEVVVSALGVREGLLYSAARRRASAHAGPAARRGARAQRAALALAAAWRGADRLDRPFHASSGLDETAEEKRAAPCRLPAGRYRLARASRLSRRAIAQHHRPCRPSSAIDHPGRAYLALAVAYRHMRPQRRAIVARACASSARPACSTAPASSAPRCASPT